MAFRNNENRNTESPRIVFANIRRPSTELLSLAGYVTFSTVTYILWFLPLFLIWAFQIEVKVSQEIILAIAGSSVELSALTLAVLGILSELNKKDRWFKIGLLFVATLFVITVLGGFYSAYTWRDEYSQPQTITIVIVGTLALGIILQLIRWSLKRWQLLPRLGSFLSFQNAIAALPFIPPIFLLFPIGGNLPGNISILFTGGVIALMVLLGVTIIAAFRAKSEEPEDEFLAILKQRYALEIKEIVRIGEVKSAIREVLLELQERSQDNNDDKSRLVSTQELKVGLRGRGLTDDERVIDEALRMLINEGVIYQHDYNSLWLVPTKDVIQICVTLFSARSIFVTLSTKNRKTDHKDGWVKGLKFEDLSSWMASKTKLSQAVIFEYVVPVLLDSLEREYDLWTELVDFADTRIHVYIRKDVDEYERLANRIHINILNKRDKLLKVESSGDSPDVWSESIALGYTFDPDELEDKIIRAIENLANKG